jgi:1-acyl-sn-glycerol-3-phosphate acyltransferase
VRVEGEVPAGPLLLCPNHLTYLDILVVASVAGPVFVSMADLIGWPLLGPLSRLGGTVYLDRARKRDAARAAEQVGAYLDRGLRVAAFLEGGAGDGSRVLRFRPPLLEPACRRGVPCAAVSIRYTLPADAGGDAAVATHVAWADDTPIAAHAMRFLRIRRTEVRVVVHRPRTGPDRKALAAALEADVARALGVPSSTAAAAAVPSPAR